MGNLPLVRRLNKPSIPAKITLIYVLIGSGWILFSDRLLAAFIFDPIVLTQLQTLKGWFYVLATAGLLYMLIRQNIAALQRSQRRFQEQEERLRLVVQNMPVLMDAFDEQGNIIFWNREAERITGYTATEIVRNPRAMELLYPDSTYRRKMLAAWAKKGNDYRDWEWELTCKDGAPKTISWSNISAHVPIFGWATWGIGVEVTERVQAEAEIRDLNTRLEQRITARTVELENLLVETQALYTISRALSSQNLLEILQTIVDAVVQILSANRVLLYILDLNKRQVTHFVRGGPDMAQTVQVSFEELWEGLTGWALRENKAALSPKDYLDPRESPQVRQRNIDLNTGDKIVVPIHYQNRMWGTLTAINPLEGRSFTQREVDLLLAMAGQAALVIESSHLLAEMHSRTAELEATNKELEAFSYSVSHDLRAPLRAIDGFSRILLEEYLTSLPPHVQHYLKLVRESTDRMGRLIDDLLIFARSGRQPLAKRTMMLADTISEVIAELKPEQENRQVEIVLGEFSACQADPKLLKQVYLNLLSNALKYTRSRDVAQIEINCQTIAGEQVYFVRDNGVGFDMRYADRLFEVFQRLHSAEQYEGAGVGLAIVQRIIHRHGGQIWAEAEIDKGATFYFTL